jgi:hypothetical protein
MFLPVPYLLIYIQYTTIQNILRYKNKNNPMDAKKSFMKDVMASKGLNLFFNAVRSFIRFFIRLSNSYTIVIDRLYLICDETSHHCM